MESKDDLKNNLTEALKDTENAVNIDKVHDLPDFPRQELDVFISYSSLNKNVADAVVSDFEQHGIRCWYAPRDIMPGQEWVTAIHEAINACKLFVLIYTDSSNESKQVANEVALAFNSGKTLIPFRLSDTEMSTELEYYLMRVHWLDAVNPPLMQSIESLREYSEKIMNGNVPKESKVRNAVVPVNNSKPAWIYPVIVAMVGVFAVIIVVLIINNNKPSDKDTVDNKVISDKVKTIVENYTDNDIIKPDSKKEVEVFTIGDDILKSSNTVENPESNVGIDQKQPADTDDINSNNQQNNDNLNEDRSSDEIIDVDNTNNNVDGNEENKVDNNINENNDNDNDVNDNDVVNTENTDNTDNTENVHNNDNIDNNNVDDNIDNITDNNSDVNVADNTDNNSDNNIENTDNIENKDKNDISDFTSEELYTLALDYQTGRSKENNFELAYECYMKTGNGGTDDAEIAQAMYELGVRFAGGNGVEQDYEKAKNLFEKAKRSNNQSAVNALGMMYVNGDGVDVDYEQALFLFNASTAAGSDIGMYNLAFMYENGYGTDVDLSTAEMYYKMSADMGNASAQKAYERLANR